MRIKRAAAFVVIGGASAAWLAAAATSARRDTTPIVVGAVPADVRGSVLDAEIDRLHHRLQPGATLQPSVRNPFAFAPRHVRAAAGQAPRPAAAPSVAVPAPSAPALTLEGLAEDVGPDGPIRSAIIASGPDLFVVKAGETVTARYRVLAVDAAGADLTDLVTGQRIRIALR